MDFQRNNNNNNTKPLGSISIFLGTNLGKIFWFLKHRRGYIMMHELKLESSSMSATHRQTIDMQYTNEDLNPWRPQESVSPLPPIRPSPGFIGAHEGKGPPRPGTNDDEPWLAHVRSAIRIEEKVRLSGKDLKS